MILHLNILDIGITLDTSLRNIIIEDRVINIPNDIFVPDLGYLHKCHGNSVFDKNLSLCNAIKYSEYPFRDLNSFICKYIEDLTSKSDFRIDLFEFQKLSTEVGYWNAKSNIKDIDDNYNIDAQTKYNKLHLKQIEMFNNIINKYKLD